MNFAVGSFGNLRFSRIVSIQPALARGAGAAFIYN
jgi:hypothetical protein